MTAVSEMYEEGRQHISDLVMSARSDARVPTCPKWTVHDVLAHLVGACADILAGNLDGAPSDQWTAAQVEMRRVASIDELLAEWDEVGPPVAQMADDFGLAGHQLLFDLTSHEHDIRAAVGRPGRRDVEPVTDAIAYLVVNVVEPRLADVGVPPVELCTDQGNFVVGSTGLHSPARVSATAFEIMRALSGRRSGRQIADYDWSVDPAPYLGVLVGQPFALPSSDIEE